MKYLIVASHPDDEALGAGATMKKASLSGHEVYVCLLSHWSPTRDDNLESGINESHSILGVKKSYIGDFGCMRFKDADHHEMVRFIETAIKDCQPDLLITHHPADIHIDHQVTNECCMEAAKLPQRQIERMNPIKRILLMEVPSSTDWSLSCSHDRFVPNIFSAVSPENIESKIAAIKVYKDVLREEPHPRSEKHLKAIAAARGSQCGSEYAEAFQIVFGLEM